MLRHQGVESSFLCLPLWSALTSFMMYIADNLHTIKMLTKNIFISLRLHPKVEIESSGWIWSPSLLHPRSWTGLATHLSSGKLAIAFYPNITTILQHQSLSCGKLASSFLSKYQYSVSKFHLSCAKFKIICF